VFTNIDSAVIKS